MKLTSTLLATAVAAGLCSTAANAADALVYDTFEPDQKWTTVNDWWDTGAPYTDELEPTNGMSITDFRRVYVGIESDTKVWTVTPPGGGTTVSDTSIITNATGWTGNFAGTVPGTNTQAGATTSTQYLALDTQGDTLSRTFTTTDVAASAPLFVDTMIQFTASDGEPSDLASSGAHVALWLDKDTTNLMAYCGCIIEGTDNTATTNCVVATEISAGTWYRLTIQSKVMDSVLFFRMAINGNWAESADFAFSGEDILHNGETAKQWFMSAQHTYGGTGSTTLSEVAFQGTGAVDNLTVTTDAPDFEATPSGVVLTLSWDSTIASVTKDGNALNSGDPIDSGDTITISAATWYALNDQGTNITGDVTISNISGAGTAFGANDYTNLTVTLTASAAATATIKAAPYGAGTITAGTNSGVDASKAAAWAIAEGITTVDGFAAKYQQYLLNADANADVDLTITSIETDDTTATIKVKATAVENATTNALSPLAFNGTVSYEMVDILGDFGTENAVNATVTVTDEMVTNDVINIVIPNSLKFIKAWVK